MHLRKETTVRRYGYDFLKDEYYSSRIIKYISNIEASRAASDIAGSQYKDVFEKLETIARVQSIKSSNAIEGIVTTDERIRSIIAGDTAPKGHSEEEIVGYRNCLDLIHGHYDEIELDEITVLELHARLMELSLVPYAGEYKTENNVISEEFADGTRRVRFTPPPADETENHMRQLLLAYKSAIQDASIPFLILVPCFILDFLCIHPFQDGNGRMSRLLTQLVLHKNGYCVGRYVSMEERINKDKESYYLALAKSSEKWSLGRNDYMPFAEFFLRILSDSYSELAFRIPLAADRKQGKAERVTTLVTRSLTALSKRDICDRLPDVSQTTVEATLAKLLKEGRIRKLGQGRSTKYIRVQSDEQAE